MKQLLLFFVGMIITFTIGNSRVQAQNSISTQQAIGDSAFEHDLRLKLPITILPATMTGAEVFSLQKRATKVGIIANQDGLEFMDAKIIVGCRKNATVGVLDAMAALWQVRIQRVSFSAYQFISPTKSYDDTFDTQDPYLKEVNAIGLKFIAALNNLPQSQKDKLLSGEPIPFSSLPAELKGFTKEMVSEVDAYCKSLNSNSSETKAADVEAGRFTLSRSNRYGFDLYNVTLLTSQSSGGWSFSNYADWKKEQNKPDAGDIKAKGLSRLYDTRDNVITQKEAKKLPPLKKIVEIHLADADWAYVLRDLHARYDIPFVTLPVRFMPQRIKTLNIPPMPLGDALDKLTELFPGTEWEYRKYGFLIVRLAIKPMKSKTITNAPAVITRPLDEHDKGGGNPP